jgi:pimeloyl-ACP methyl ester carboxylesterase
VAQPRTLVQEQNVELYPGIGDIARRRLHATLPVAERRLALAGISTSVLEGGNGQPVILLHGPAGYAAHWLRVIPGLAARHRVIVPDLPGHGASAAGDRPLDAGRVLAWLGALIDATCDSPPALVGQLVGGAIAARFAAAHGDRISRLVLIDGFGLRPFEPEPAFGRAVEAFLAGPSEATHDELWRYCAHNLDALRQGMGASWDALRAYNVDRASAPAVQTAVGAVMETFAMPAIPPEELARIAVPTTLIWGRHDRATPLAVAETASARFGWPLVVIEDSADDPSTEQPEATLRALHATLDGDPPQQADHGDGHGADGGRVGQERPRL